MFGSVQIDFLKNGCLTVKTFQESNLKYLKGFSISDLYTIALLSYIRGSTFENKVLLSKLQQNNISISGLPEVYLKEII